MSEKESDGMTKPECVAIRGACSQCRQPATHRFTEDLRTGYAELKFCCECYSMAVVHCYKPGSCGEYLTLADLGISPATVQPPSVVAEDRKRSDSPE